MTVTRRLQLALPASLLAVSVGLLGACGADESGSAVETEPVTAAPFTPAPTPTPDGEPGTEASTATQPEVPDVPDGRIVAWDDYDADRSAYADSTVVLYFHAPWCHECQATDEAISTTGIPPGLTLVQIDYDSRTDLRQDYGVTIQHSFVLIDDTGERQDIWTDTISGSEIAARAA